MTDEILAAILSEIRGLRADLRRAQDGADASAELVAAIEERFGPAPFTVAGLLDVADSDPYCAIAETLGRLFGLDDPQRAVRLGIFLARAPGVRSEGLRRGARLYRMSGLDA